MKRLVVLILTLALSAAGITGCGMYMSDESEGWTASGDGQYSSGDTHMHCDPEIEARAEMY